MEESAVADAVEALGQGVEEEPADELDSVHDPGFEGSGIAVFDTDTDAVSLEGEDTMIGDDAATDVLPEILDGVLAVSGPVDIGVPVGFDELPEQFVSDQPVVPG
ncbi:hypothetical protein J3R74_002164 [Puniceicoccus vermicola]